MASFFDAERFLTGAQAHVRWVESAGNDTDSFMVARRQLSPERLRLQGDDLGRYVLRGSEAIYVGRQPVGSTAAFAGSAILTRALDFSLPNRSCQVGCAPVGPDSACGVDGVLVGIPLLDAAQGLQICTLDDLKTLTLLPLEALEAIAAREAQ